jgi:5-methylcytosine-specific restriction endonuclease McrA
MAITPSEWSLLLRRSGEQYESQKRRARAAGQCILYRLEDLRGLLEKSLAEAVCVYCRQPFSAASYALDHKLPVARGGRFSFRNLDVSCQDCNAIKGVLDSQELRELLIVVNGWPKPVRKNFLARLKAGTLQVADALPPHGALEWFTGSDEAHEPPDLYRGQRPRGER